MNINSIKNDPMKLIFLLLCMFCCSLIMAQKSVKRDIMIRVMDEENNPIEQPHVAVYDSLHNFLFEGEAETTGHGSIQKIWVEDYGRYFLIFSKDGYETISTEVEFRNRIMNSSPDGVMKRDLNTALSPRVWWYVCVGILVLLGGAWLIRKKRSK